MAKIRLFAYRGMIQLQQRMVKQYNADSVFVLDEPYIWGQALDTNGLTPVSSAPDANADAQLLQVEVPSNTAIRYEINPNGPSASTTRVAGPNSPKLTGTQTFPWNAGYSISIIDAAGT